MEGPCNLRRFSEPVGYSTLQHPLVDGFTDNNYWLDCPVFHDSFHIEAVLLAVESFKRKQSGSNLRFRTVKETNMAKNTIPINWYLDVAEVFHWATIVHFILWFTGSWRRHRRTETVLRRLVKSGKLRAIRYGKRLIYSVPRRVKGKSDDELWGLSKVVHGLACTECLVRFWRSKMDGEVIAERFFYGLGSVPEWGIRYPNGKMILLEFCTKSNFYFSGLMKGKLGAYTRNIAKIEEKFQAKAIVVFVIDVPRETVNRFVGNLKRDVGSVADGDQSASYEGDRFPSDPFFFTDYETFLKVPIGKQLTENIYFWVDGKTYPLRKS